MNIKYTVKVTYHKKVAGKFEPVDIKTKVFTLSLPEIELGGVIDHAEKGNGIGYYKWEVVSREVVGCDYQTTQLVVE
jgi:hypothetical protein